MLNYYAQAPDTEYDVIVTVNDVIVTEYDVIVTVNDVIVTEYDVIVPESQEGSGWSY